MRERCKDFRIFIYDKIHAIIFSHNSIFLWYFLKSYKTEIMRETDAKILECLFMIRSMLLSIIQIIDVQYRHLGIQVSIRCHSNVQCSQDHVRRYRNPTFTLQSRRYCNIPHGMFCNSNPFNFCKYIIANTVKQISGALRYSDITNCKI